MVDQSELLEIKKMNLQRNKTLSAIALILILTVSGIMASIPAANAHTPPQTHPTFAYLSMSPSPAGVGQTVLIVMWVSPNPPTATGYGGDVWRNFTVTITKPNGNTQTLGPFNADATGSTYTVYVPDQVGTYKFVFNYPGQVISLYGPTGIPSDTSVLTSFGFLLGGDRNLLIGDTFTGSSATETLTVQQQQIAKIPDTPPPTSYWTRPIYGQNSAWASVASNWLGGAQIGVAPGGTNNLWQSGVGPNSPHIMWTKPIELGGIVGNTQTVGVSSYEIPDVGYYSGGSYEGRFTNAMIIAGNLYYADPLGHSNTGGGYTCVDLRTGQVVWHSDNLATTIGNIPGVGPNTILVPSFGQLFDYESQNQHGVVGGILWYESGGGPFGPPIPETWVAYDAFTGKWLYNLTNVPTGYTVYTDMGAIVRYVFNYNTATKSGSLALWNDTQHNAGLELTPAGGNASVAATTNAYQWRPNGGSFDMGQPYAYSWTVTINADLSGSAAPSIIKVIPGDLILGQSSGIGFLSLGGTPDPYTIWAISDKPATRGQLLWIKNYPAPANGVSRTFSGSSPVDTVNRVFFMQDTETFAWTGYSLDTGAQLWGPVTGATRAFSYYGSGLGGGQFGFAAYGNLYTQGFGGEICCFSGKTGTLLWKFNNTNSGDETAYGNYPIFIAAIADGKVYAFTNEHSPNYPLYKGEKIFCIDANTGNEIYEMLSLAGQTGGNGGETSVLADGYLAYYNYYDNSIYCVGKGPSATTVTATPGVGNVVTIQGTVTDQSAGAKNKVQSGEFNMVPAVSDASMGSWMQYIYMQQPIPGHATGVPVTLTAVDQNGKTYNIGTVTSDITGLFHIAWTPPATGEYSITASFGGSNSYWPSYAEAAISVGSAASPQPTPTAPTSPAAAINVYIIAAVVVVIVVIAAAALLIRSRRK